MPITIPDWTPETRLDWLRWIGRSKRRHQLVLDAVCGPRDAQPQAGVRITLRPRNPERDRQIWEYWLAGHSQAEVAQRFGMKDGAQGAKRALERLYQRARAVLGLTMTAPVRSGDRDGNAGGRSGRTGNQRSAGYYAAHQAELSARARSRKSQAALGQHLAALRQDLQALQRRLARVQRALAQAMELEAQ